ncbi:MAG: hypothetical protein WCT85_02840 [Parachlamydiales bacterium]|jgi:hypothetical protein
MGNKKTIFKIEDIYSKINYIKKNLYNAKNLNVSDVLNYTDNLDQLSLTSIKINDQSKNVFMKNSIKNIEEDIHKIFGTIEEIESSRQIDDDEILNRLHRLLYLEDYLELRFFSINSSEIETILAFIEDELSDISKEKAFNNFLIDPIIDEIKSKLQNLKFRFDFPIVEELNEKKPSYAHRILIEACDLKSKDPEKSNILIKKIDDLSDLVWLAKMFMYKDFDKALHIFDKLDERLKDKIKKNIWKISGEQNRIIKNKYSSALMEYVAEEINA